MKKFITFTLCGLMVMLSSLMFVGCKKDKDTITLNEVTHSVFYAPLYLAINLGYMEDEGIKINLENGQGSDKSMAALLSGNAEIALLGPETVVYVAAQGSTNHPVVFGQLTKRDGSFLVSKTDERDTFNWSTSLVNKKVIAGRKGGLPAMTFEWVVNNANLYHGQNITLDTETSFAMQVPVFDTQGGGDYCTMFEPTATEYQESGRGYIVASVGEYSGEIPYTCFMATPKFIKNNPDKIEGFLRAIKKAYAYIMTNDDLTVAKALVPSFDGSTAESLAKAVKSYKEIDAWCASPAMTLASYNKLLAVLKNAGELEGNVDFEDVVDNTYALSVA